MELSARTFELDSLEDAVEFTYAQGWTDGLPVVPPTSLAIQRVLDYLGRDSKELVGIVPPRNGQATIEKIAINCVMAGCRPEYSPVVIAALEAMLEPAFNLFGVQGTTHCCAPLIIVSGPLVKELRFNYSENVFGGGSRANATIGRAIRLILWNIGGGYPGDVDMATLGHPGKYTFCVAENPDQNPWEPLHVERGLKKQQSGVTVLACESPHHIGTGTGYVSAEDALIVIADSMATLGNNNMHAGGDMLLALGPMTAQAFVKAGYSKNDIRMSLMRLCGKPVGIMQKAKTLGQRDYLHPTHWSHILADPEDKNAMVPLIRKPENLLIIVTGGWGSGAGFSAFCPGWGLGGWAQTKAVKNPM